MEKINVEEVSNIKDIYDFENAIKLGEGAYGKVYKVMHKQLQQYFAVKAVRKKDLDAELGNQMMTELTILSDFDHPNIMQVKALRHDRKKFYIVTELCEGGELFDRLVDVGPLSE